jgi:hypothetical protein
MKKSIHIVSVLLCLAIPATVQAQFTYTTNAGGLSVTITGDPGAVGALIIPNNINGLTVSEVGEDAFYSFHPSTSLTSVTIPGTVTNIGSAAFANCAGLTNATISKGVNIIGEDVFADCTSLGSVSIPSSVISIGDEAFEGCILTNVAISNGVTSIGQFTFEYDPFSSIAIPDTITNIGYGAFANCESLTNAVIPNSVTSLGDFAFFGCSSLTNVTIASGVTDIAYAMFQLCTNLTSAFFQGNSPSVVGDPQDGPVFYDDPDVTVYYLPGTTGWSNTYQGVPAVLWNPEIRSNGANFVMTNHQFGFQITGTSNIPIVLQACTNLTSPVWTTLTNVNLTNGVFNFSEPMQTNAPGRYYRITAP